MSNNSNQNLVDVRDLKMHFPITTGWMFRKTVGHIRAVDGMSFKIARGETRDWLAKAAAAKPPRDGCFSSWRSQHRAASFSKGKTLPD